MKQAMELLQARAEDEEFQMAPLIDCVFLLLIYFMLTTSLLRLETDLGFSLPGQVQQGLRLVMPDEQIIEVRTSGDVTLNNQVFGNRDENGMAALQTTLQRFRESAQLAGLQAMVTVQADDGSVHQRLIDVMNACAGAGITNISFGMMGADSADANGGQAP